MQIVVNSLLTTYEQIGNGKNVVLLLHGWGDSHKTFRELQRELSKEYITVSLDLPGFGATQAPEAAWDLKNYADFVRDFLSKINVRPYAVIGHSNGAAVAIHGAAEKLLIPQKLILIGAAGIRNKQKLHKAGLKVVAKTGKVATFWLPGRHKKKLQKALYGAAGSDMLVAPHLKETFKKTVAQDVQKDAAKLDLPVLLIYGDNDRATPPLFGSIYQSLMPSAQLEVVKNADHFVHQTQATTVVQLIREFLQ